MNFKISLWKITHFSEFLSQINHIEFWFNPQIRTFSTQKKRTNKHKLYKFSDWKAKAALDKNIFLDPILLIFVVSVSSNVLSKNMLN